MGSLIQNLGPFLVGCLAAAGYWRSRTRGEDSRALLVYGILFVVTDVARRTLDPHVPSVSPTMSADGRALLHLDHALFFLASWITPIVTALATQWKQGLVAALAAPIITVGVCIVGFPLGPLYPWVVTTNQVLSALLAWGCFTRAIFGSPPIVPTRTHLVLLIMVALDTVIGLFTMANNSVKGFAALVGDWDVIRFGNVVAGAVCCFVLLYDRRPATVR